MKRTETPLKLHDTKYYKSSANELRNPRGNMNNTVVRTYYREYFKNKDKQYVLEFTHYEKILHRIMFLLCEKILKGFELYTPIGIFSIWRVFNKSPEQKDWRATRRAREEAREKGEDDNIIVMRTNEYHHRICWTKSSLLDNLKVFSFKVNKLISHDIPKHEHLYFNVPVRK